MNRRAFGVSGLVAVVVAATRSAFGRQGVTEQTWVAGVWDVVPDLDPRIFDGRSPAAFCVHAVAESDRPVSPGDIFELVSPAWRFSGRVGVTRRETEVGYLDAITFAGRVESVRRFQPSGFTSPASVTATVEGARVRARRVDVVRVPDPDLYAEVVAGLVNRDASFVAADRIRRVMDTEGFTEDQVIGVLRELRKGGAL